jgi:NAD(P)-dependent dehydrogenase (short-subunit alcohol dehydrogenase family)
MGKLDGRVVIVTGAARGLGRAYAKRLAGLGAKVFVVDLNLHAYEESEAEAKDILAKVSGGGAASSDIGDALRSDMFGMHLTGGDRATATCTERFGFAATRKCDFATNHHDARIPVM